MIITDGISKIEVKDEYSVSLECKENIFSILIETGDDAVQVGYYKSSDYAVKVLDIIENLLHSSLAGIGQSPRELPKGMTYALTGKNYTNKFDVPLTDMEDVFIVTDGDETIVCENVCNLRVEDDYLIVENSTDRQRFGPLDYAHNMWQECCQAKARGEKFFIITDTLRSEKFKKESKLRKQNVNSPKGMNFIRIQGAWIRVPETGVKTRIEHEEDAWYIYLDFKNMDLKVSAGYSSKEMAEIACDYLKDDQQIMVLPPEKFLAKKKLRCEIIECKKGYFFLSVFVMHKDKRINIAKLGQYKTLEHAQAAKEILDKKFNSKPTV